MEPGDEYYDILFMRLMRDVGCRNQQLTISPQRVCLSRCKFNSAGPGWPVCYTNIKCTHPKHPLNMTVAEAVLEDL